MLLMRMSMSVQYFENSNMKTKIKQTKRDTVQLLPIRYREGERTVHCRSECRYHRHHRGMSQDYMKALCSGYAQGSATHALMRACTQIDTGTHADTNTSRAIHQHAQIRLPSDILIPFFMLFISMSPNSCSGACTNTYTQAHPHTRTLPPNTR